MLTSVPSALSASFYPIPLDDPKAVTLAPDQFPSVRGDGVHDDTDALQTAVNRVQETTRKGIVFIPPGRYRISHTVYVWNGIRLIGVGATRPVILLGPHTPGYQTGDSKYMLHFVSDRPDAGKAIVDANPGTFYSAVSNVDIEIGDGNPAAVGIRFHIAQHCYLAHMDFRIGGGRAGVEEIGNEAEDVHFFGGDYGINTHKPSPSWPFLLIDSSFDGQRKACIRTEEGGLTLVRDTFAKSPCAISVNEGRAEELWSVDSRFEDITGPALVISSDKNPRTEINVMRAVCRNVPVLAAFRDGSPTVPGPGAIYRVDQFTHGLVFDDIGADPTLKTIFLSTPLAADPGPGPSDIPTLPDPDTWVNVAQLGAQGDGVTDNTAILRKAISEHTTLYFPTGRYRVSDTITLRPDTVLIGLSPIATQILITDSTRGFDGPGGPKPLVEAPGGGANIITGIGLDTGGANTRAVALLWKSGAGSLVNDVRFVGGHGTYKADGTWIEPYNNNRTGDPDPKRRWDSQYPSLWVTDGGGGTFKDIWTPSTYAQAGLYVSNTSTEGRVYAMSSEHHVRNEVKLRNVSHWNIYDLQCEEERGEGPSVLPLSIDGCNDITLANIYLYRVYNTYSPYPYAVKIHNSTNITFHNLHLYSPSKLAFDNTVYDSTHNIAIRDREIALLHCSGDTPPARTAPPPSTVLAPGASVEKVAGGFNNIDGAAVDTAGNVYFVDARWNSIYRYTPDTRDVTLVLDSPIQPIGLAFDRSGDLLIVCSTGNVYSLPPGGAEDLLTLLTAVDKSGAPYAPPRGTATNAPAVDGDVPELPAAAARFAAPVAPGTSMTSILPVSRWRDSHDFLDANLTAPPYRYISPDGSVDIPAAELFVRWSLPDPPGSRPRWTLGNIDLMRAYAFAPATPGVAFYVADEFNQQTWAFDVQPDGALANPRLFAQEGEAGTVVDSTGNVYIAAGQVSVYNPHGDRIETILVPDRPNCLVLGGADRKTLYIAARGSLYAARLR
ncbi:MAG: glycosyl hydrolase family 28-related protein [Capsulimonadaceae bacterium]